MTLKEFLGAFRWDGIATEVVRVVEDMYHLDESCPNWFVGWSANGGRNDFEVKPFEEAEAHKMWLAKEYKGEKAMVAEAKKFRAFYAYDEDAMFWEIEEKFEQCKDKAGIDRVLGKILRPFNDFLMQYYLIPEMISNDRELKELEALTEPTATDKANIEYHKRQMAWLNFRVRKLEDLLFERTTVYDDGSVTYWLSEINRIVGRFGDRLYSLLLTYQIDLNKVQQEKGIFLRPYYNIANTAGYLTRAEAKRYIAALQGGVAPSDGQQPTGTGRQLLPVSSAKESRTNVCERMRTDANVCHSMPQHTTAYHSMPKMPQHTTAYHSMPKMPQHTTEYQQDTTEIPTINGTNLERTVFGNALQMGYMSLENGCYQWKKSKALLAYMCGRLYCDDSVTGADSYHTGEYIKGCRQLPATAVKRLFGVDVANNRCVMKQLPRGSWTVDELFKDKGANK